VVYCQLKCSQQLEWQYSLAIHHAGIGPGHTGGHVLACVESTFRQNLPDKHCKCRLHAQHHICL